MLEKLSKEMKIAVIVMSTLLVLGIIYGGGVIYFQNRFLPNTTFAGIAVSNQDIEQASQTITTKLDEGQLAFSENENEIGYVNIKELGLNITVAPQLQKVMEEQNPYAWLGALIGLPRTQIPVNDDTLGFNMDLLDMLIPNLGVKNDQRTPTTDAEIRQQGDHYAIVPEVYGNQINPESLKNAIISTLNSGQSAIDLKNAYVQPKVTTETEALNQSYDKIAHMESSEITLTFDGNEILIPKATISSWIFINENGEPDVDYDAVENYVRDLNNQYAGLFQQRKFNSTYQGEVIVEPGTYGWYIDRFVETDAIIADVKAGAKVSREPSIGGSGYGMGDSVGGSYVEVDILNQMMVIYHDGEAVLTTPVVTGLPGTNTVPGAYQVWNMETPSVLVGYNPNTGKDYEQPVEYWIAFDDQAQGLHDASWQSSFGGSAYLYSGSLGCVNIPPSVMPQVFELVYYGMPVIIF